MMKQLKLRNGDLVLGTGGFVTLTGTERIIQDLGALVREVMGTDRFHPAWGTILQDYLGGYQDEEAAMLVRGEIARVVQNYIVMQSTQIIKDRDLGLRSRYAPEEIISSVRSIETQAVGDRLNVKVSVGTMSGQTVDIIRSVEA